MPPTPLNLGRFDLYKYVGNHRSYIKKKETLLKRTWGVVCKNASIDQS